MSCIEQKQNLCTKYLKLTIFQITQTHILIEIKTLIYIFLQIYVYD